MSHTVIIKPTEHKVDPKDARMRLPILDINSV